MGDGHLNKCKDCAKKDVREREQELLKNPEWLDLERKRHREKYYRLEYKEKHKPSLEKKKVIIERYRIKHSEKYAATSLSSGLKAPAGMEKHHWSYNLEHAKDVIFVTNKQHAKAHRFLVYDEQEKMYRDLDGNLLSTKESHSEYIFRMINEKED